MSGLIRIAGQKATPNGVEQSIDFDTVTHFSNINLPLFCPIGICLPADKDHKEKIITIIHFVKICVIVPSWPSARDALTGSLKSTFIRSSSGTSFEREALISCTRSETGFHIEPHSGFTFDLIPFLTPTCVSGLITLNTFGVWVSGQLLVLSKHKKIYHTPALKAHGTRFHG